MPGTPASIAAALPQPARRGTVTAAELRLRAEPPATAHATPLERAATVTAATGPKRPMETEHMQPNRPPMVGRRRLRPRQMETDTATASRRLAVRLRSRRQVQGPQADRLPLLLAQAGGRLRPSRPRPAPLSGTVFPGRPSRRPSRRQAVPTRRAPARQAPSPIQPTPSGVDKVL